MHHQYIIIWQYWWPTTAVCMTTPHQYFYQPQFSYHQYIIYLTICVRSFCQCNINILLSVATKLTEWCWLQTPSWLAVWWLVTVVSLSWHREHNSAVTTVATTTVHQQCFCSKQEEDFWTGRESWLFTLICYAISWCWYMVSSFSSLYRTSALSPPKLMELQQHVGDHLPVWKSSSLIYSFTQTVTCNTVQLILNQLHPKLWMF